MKISITSLFAIIALFVSSNIMAQMGGMGTRGNINGVDRSIARSQYGDGPKKHEKVDYVQTALDNLKKELNLDGFQEAVIKDLMTENQAEAERILAMDTPNDSKAEKMNELREKTSDKIVKILNKDQVEKYAKLREKAKKK